MFVLTTFGIYLFKQLNKHLVIIIICTCLVIFVILDLSEYFMVVDRNKASITLKVEQIFKSQHISLFKRYFRYRETEYIEFRKGNPPGGNFFLTKLQFLWIYPQVQLSEFIIATDCITLIDKSKYIAIFKHPGQYFCLKIQHSSTLLMIKIA